MMKVFSVKGVIQATGLSRSFIYEEIQSGRLPVRKAGRRTLILEKEVEKWLMALPPAVPSGKPWRPGDPKS